VHVNKLIRKSTIVLFNFYRFELSSEAVSVLAQIVMLLFQVQQVFVHGCCLYSRGNTAGLIGIYKECSNEYLQNTTHRSD